MTGGTVTPGLSTIRFLTNGGTIIGGGNTLYNVTLSAVGTVNVTTSNLNISGALTLNGAGDTLSIASGITVTTSAALGTMNGTIGGSGTLVYQSSTTFPTTGTISSILRMDATSNDQTMGARTYGGAVEIYNNSGSSARTVTLGTASSQTLTFSSNLTLNAANSQNITLQGATRDPTVNVTGNFAFTGAGGGTEVVTAPDAAATWTITGNIDLDNGTWTASAETLTMNGTSNTLEAGGQTIRNLTIDPSSVGTITAQTSDLTVSNLLTVAASDTLSIASGRTITLSLTSGSALTLNGTVSGVGTLIYSTTTTFPSGGTMSSALRMDATSANVTLSARTYGGNVECYSNSSSAVRDVVFGTAGSQTITISGNLTANAANTQNVRCDVTSWDPNPTISGSVDFTGTGGGQEQIMPGNGTWTVSGSFDLTDGALTGSATWTLVMNGTGTLTTNNNNFNNVTLSGTITISSSNPLNVYGNLDMTGGTVTSTSTTVLMAGLGSFGISGGGQTLNNLTISPSGGGGTINLQTSDLTVAGALDVRDGDTLSINGSRTLIHTGSTLTFNTSGTISGAGTLAYQSSTTFPAAGTMSAGLRMDATNNDQTLSARTYGGSVEAYNNHASSHRVVTLAAGTHTYSGNLTLQAANTRNITLAGDTSNPTVNITGDIDFTGAGSGTEDIITGTSTWTVQGNVSVADGVLTATAGNTFYLNGSGGMYDLNPKTHAGVTFSTLRIGATEDVAMWNSTATTFTIDAGGCLFSQDHGTTDGRFQLYGACNTRATETWSYATDFDGAGLGTPRTADVRLAAGASLTIDNGDTLNILGQSASANRTAITRQASGNYALTINGTVNARYYDIDYTDASGLNIGSAATVTNLSDGSFDNVASGASAAYITVTGITSTATFTNNVFDSAGDGADANVVYNINADGAGIVWIMAGAGGNKAGESFDREMSGASVSWSGVIDTVNDGTGIDIDVQNSTTTISANWAVSDPSGVDHYEYAIGTTPGGTQVTSFTSTGLSTNVTRTGLALANSTTYFVIVRSYNASSEIIASGISDGVTVDTAAPTFSSISTVVTSSTIAITWTTNEAATTKVLYGLTGSYGSQTTEDTNLVTSHAATLSGLSAGTLYHFQLQGTDTATNVGNSTDQTAITSAPNSTVITNTQSIIVSSTSVRITWTTNHPADSKVRYGLTTAYGLEVYDPTLVTSHSLTLTGLTPGATYHYEVLSVGNTSTNDADATFTTSSSSAPAPGAPTLRQPIVRHTDRTTMTVTGLSKGGLTVRIYVDNTVVATRTVSGQATDIKSFALRFNLSLFRPGKYTIGASATNVRSQASPIRRQYSVTIGALGSAKVYRFDRTVAYIVQTNDTLSRISRTFYGGSGRYPQIINQNRTRFTSLLTSPNIIQPGWSLVIPR